jgi:hypothetical protein
VFTSALYKVASLPAAPVASRVEDLPTDFRTNYLEAAAEANIAVNALRKITKDVFEMYSVDDTASAETSEDVQLMGTCKRMKYDNDNERSGQGSILVEVVKNKLKVVCDSYAKARLMLAKEMQKYEKFMATIMIDAVPDVDKVLFSARGELVTASRAALTNTTERTYFQGLLNSGGWKSDVIGRCTIALNYNLYNAEIV